MSTSPRSLRERVLGPAPGIVEVWRVPLPAGGTPAEADLRVLDDAERARAMRPGPRGAAFARAHAALRAIVGVHLGIEPREVRMNQTEGRKPRLVGAGGLAFSLSHAQGLALIALASDREVGIDVERLSDAIDIETVAAAFLPPPEVAAVSMAPVEVRRRAFFTAWTRHEARLKLRGRGLDAAPSAAAEDVVALVLVRALNVGEEYAAAVAAEGAGWQVELKQHP
jgi:4'-phosphopantetheinyl transferase